MRVSSKGERPGLWLWRAIQRYAEAAFDLGATSRDEFIVRFRDTHLRIVFFEGPPGRPVIERPVGVHGQELLS